MTTRQTVADVRSGTRPSRSGRGRGVLLLGVDTAVGVIAVDLSVLVAGPADLGVAELLYPVLGVGGYLLAGLLSHGYANPRPTEGRGYRAVVHRVLAVGAGLTVLSALAGTPLGRAVALVLLPTLLVGGLVSRWLLGRRWRREHRAGVGVRRVLAVGDAWALNTLVTQLSRDTDHALVVVGACLDGELGPDADIAVVGRLPGPDQHDVAPLIHSAAVDAVLRAAAEVDAEVVCVAAGSTMRADHLRALRWALADRGVGLLLTTGFDEVAASSLVLSSAGAANLAEVQRSGQGRAAAAATVVIDRVGALVLLALLAPLLAAVAVAVRVDSSGRALFAQTRVGAGGREFTIWKFRSMTDGAHGLKASIAERNERDGALFKIVDDPRVTRVGRVLRRTSLDELPQLVNVLRGEMSLVGPRPALPEEVAVYDDVARRRLRARPGITGLWQVSGRSSLSWAETVRLDLWYVDNRSPLLDLRIIWRTVEAVVRGTGAH